MRAIVDKGFVADSGRDHLSYQEIFGLSTENKPVTGLVTGSSFTEVDTGDIYLFDEDGNAGEEWVKQFSLQS